MPRRSPRKTSKVILDYTEEQPTFTDYLALWVWLGWFVLLPTFFVVLAASYWYCKPLFFTLAGKFILLLAYPVSRDWQPAFCWKIGSWIMNASCRYFSCKVIFEDEDALKKMGPAVYALEPHDILPLGIFTLSENIEGIDVYGAKRGGMASILFRIPFMKQVYTWANAIAADKAGLNACLCRGESVMICPGGVSEVGYIAKDGYHPRNDCVLFLKKRLGFLKLCIQNQVPLVPYFCFGQRAAYDFYIPKSKMLMWLGRKMGFLPMMFSGIFGLPMGPPKPSPVTAVAGKPISPPPRGSSDEKLFAFQSAVFDEYRRIYDLHKNDAGYGDVVLHIE